MRLQLALVGLVISSSAYAADLPRRTTAPDFVAPPPAFTWTGFYIGANAGYAGTFHQDANLTSQNAIVGGGTVGFNYQPVGPLVLGVEADFDALANINHNTNGGVLVDRKLDFLATARGRVGYAITDRFMVYGTGGVAAGRAVLNGPLFAPGSTSSIRWGFVGGGGVEYAITPNWSVKAEGLFYSLAKQTMFGAGAPVTVTASARNDGFIARAGVNYRFGAAVLPVFGQ